MLQNVRFVAFVTGRNIDIGLIDHYCYLKYRILRSELCNLAENSTAGLRGAQEENHRADRYQA